MKIGSAIPRLLERKYPTVRPSYPLLTVLYLLRIQDIPAVPIVGDGKAPRAVFGFSVLPKMMDLTPKTFDAYLSGPCEAASDELESFSMDDDVEDLLESFERTKLGVSLVSGKARGQPHATLVTLVDLLRLYKTRQFTSDMLVEEVGSPIVALPGKTSVRDAVQTMFRLKVRRVFISGERMYISDRSIVERVLSPASLVRSAGEEGIGALKAEIETLKKTSPIEVQKGTSLQSAALRLRSDWGPCLTVQGEDRVLTPWDVIMKPWAAERLTIRSQPRD